MTLGLVFTLIFIGIVAMFLLRDVRQGAQLVNQREQLTLWLRLQQEPNMVKNVKLHWETTTPLPKKVPDYLNWTSCDALPLPDGLMLVRNWQHTPAEIIYLYNNDADSENYPGVQWRLGFFKEERFPDLRIVYSLADAKAKQVTLLFP
jgi:hypothetical protein